MNSNEIQNAYVDLYTQMRKYIWPFDVIDILVDLEIESFKSFPDSQKLLLQAVPVLHVYS